MTLDDLARRPLVLALFLALAPLYLLAAASDYLGQRGVALALAPHEARRLAQERGSERLPPVPRWPDVEGLTRAVRLSPANAEARYALGKAYHRVLLLGKEARPETRRALYEKAETEYRRAIRLNAAHARAHFWRGMLQWAAADGRVAVGAPEEHRAIAERSLRAALRLRPHDMAIAAEAGAFFWSQGREEEAIRAFETSLAAGRDQLPRIADLLLERPDGPTRLVQSLPDTEEDHLALSALFFDRARFDDAARAWRRAAELGGRDVQDGGPGVGAVANGGFERPFGESFHDWRVEPVAGVAVDRVRDRPAEGGAALAISFDRGRVNYFHVVQDVPVAPLARYRIAAEVRSEGVPAGERVGIEALAGETLLCAAATEPAPDWRPVECAFDVPWNVWHVRLRVRRTAPEGEEGSGTMFVDGVNLTELPVGGP